MHAPAPFRSRHSALGPQGEGTQGDVGVRSVTENKNNNSLVTHLKMNKKQSYMAKVKDYMKLEDPQYNLEGKNRPSCG